MATTSTTKTGDSADEQAAEALGVGEGEIRALRDDAGVNQSAGFAHTLTWEASEGGKAYLADEDKRQKAIKDEVKANKDATDDDGLNEAERKYVEALDKAAKS